MPRREVKQVLASYRDAGGAMRYALQGTTVDVDPKDLERFDKANGTESQPPVRKATPAKKKAPQKRVKVTPRQRK